MKTLKLILAFVSLIIFTKCQNRTSNISSNIADTIIKHDTVFIDNAYDWQKSFGLTHNPKRDSVWGKSVKYYIDNPQCSPIAIDFYLGQFRPSDNYTTSALLELVTTNNEQLRPFYRWCLNKTIQVQDGALGELTGVPARQYAEQYPKEFFQYMDADTTGERYLDWVNSILYSGFYDNDDYRKPQDIRKRMIQTMKKNCRDCNEPLEQRIDKFATDCFQ